MEAPSPIPPQNIFTLDELATFVGCHRGTITGWVASGRVTPSDMARWGERETYRFSRATALRLKAEWDCNKGDGIWKIPAAMADTLWPTAAADEGIPQENAPLRLAYTIQRAATQTRLPVCFIKCCLAATSLLPEGYLPSARWPPNSRDHAKPRGRRPINHQRTEEDRGLTLILAKDSKRLELAVRQALKESKSLDREKWMGVGALIQKLNLTKQKERYEFTTSLTCWAKQGLIQSRVVLVKARGLRPRELTMWMWGRAAGCGAWSAAIA
jgi:hypothetical protein